LAARFEVVLMVSSNQSPGETGREEMV